VCSIHDAGVTTGNFFLAWFFVSKQSVIHTGSDGTQSTRHTVNSAPANFGKVTVIADVLQACSRPPNRTTCRDARIPFFNIPILSVSVENYPYPYPMRSDVVNCYPYPVRIRGSIIASQKMPIGLFIFDGIASTFRL